MNVRIALAAAIAATAAIGYASPSHAEQRVIVIQDAQCGESFDYINASGASHNDNHIDVTEAISADMPDKLFEALDKDNDLIITREEFNNCVSYTDQYETWTIVIVDDAAVPARAASNFSVCDYKFSILNRNAAVDNHISLSEAQAWDISADTFTRLDKDGDEMISREEFLDCQS
ncbi:MAG: hypothetical protein JJ899_09810, partial [Alphaproteobacteria bacterium]|nr:hypothetical protein [Alphaproteobacteria bacterium]